MAADQKAALEDVRRQVEKVRGQVEEIRYRVERTARVENSSSQLKALEERLAAIERRLTRYAEPSLPPPAETRPPGSLEPQPVSPEEQGPPTAAKASTEEMALALEPSVAQDEYRTALQAMGDKQFDKAIQLFRSFVRKYPRSQMADDASYWIGESYYAQRKYYEAILSYNDVLRDYERGDRAPAALLRQASAFAELGNKIDARVTLQTLIRKYPNTAEAEQAKETLQTPGG
jgi:tol-pal system protein YbgF